MTRSNGLPRRSGTAGLTHVIRARTSATTVSRPTETQGSLDESTSTTNDHIESVWLFEPREAPSEELTGERVNGSLGLLAVADGSVDLQRDDRIVHGGVEYEIDTIVGHPADGTPDGTDSHGVDFWKGSLVRRQ